MVIVFLNACCKYPKLRAHTKMSLFGAPLLWTEPLWDAENAGSWH